MPIDVDDWLRMYGDVDVVRPPVPSKWRRINLLDPISQLYDDADCDSWHVPGQRSTGPCDPAWKGDYDRDAVWSRGAWWRGRGAYLDCESWVCPKPATSDWTALIYRGQVLQFAPCDDACTICGHCGEPVERHR